MAGCGSGSGYRQWPGIHQQHLCLLQTEPGGEECVSEADKVAMDPKDPNRPRFTLQELRDVLHERNELKSKVFLLQEELAYYKR